MILFGRLQLGERNGLDISLPTDNIQLTEKNWQRPFFKVVKLNFHSVASLSFPFQISSHLLTCKIANSKWKSFSFFCRWVKGSKLCQQEIIFWFKRPFLRKLFFKISLQVKFQFKFTPPPALHWVKSNEGVAPTVSGSETTLNCEIKALTALRSSPTSYYSSNAGFNFERFFDNLTFTITNFETSDVTACYNQMLII